MHNTSRRAFIAGSTAAAVAASLPAAAILPTSARAWDAALARYHATAAEYEREKARCRREFGSVTALPLEHSRELDRLCEATCDAAEGVIKTPAPDGAALRWKLDYLTEGFTCFDGWSDDYAAQTLADMARLLPQGR